MKNSWKVFVRYRYLLANLIERDLKVKYRRSVLGVLWSVLNPLLMMLVITAVFSKLFRFQVPNYHLYFLVGNVVYGFLNEATTGAMGAVLSNGALLRKVYIPKYIFPLEKCLFAFVNLLFSMIAVVIVMLCSGVWPTFTFLLFPLVILITLAFCIGLGLLLSSLAVFFRDVIHLYGIFLVAWMYATPIIYPLDLQNLPNVIMVFMRINPLYYYVTMMREVVLYNTLPSLSLWAIGCAMAAGMLLLGLWVFKRQQDRFVLYI